MNRIFLIIIFTFCTLITTAAFASSPDQAEDTIEEIASAELEEILRAAKEGDPDAQLDLGVAFRLGRGVPQDFGESTSWLLKAAEQGEVEAQYLISEAFDQGMGVTKNSETAAKWAKQAAEQGLKEAQALLGAKYYLGDGVPLDYEISASWLHKAADQGVADSQYALSRLYNEGVGVTKDPAAAAAWIQKAAEQGLMEAQAMLGANYLLGDGVRRNYKNAVKWLSLAAERGHANAQHVLGAAYDEGKGVRRSYKKAVEWYRKAAEQGNVRAQTDLGLMLIGGLGVRRNPFEACKWFSIATEGGDQQAFEQGIFACLELTPEKRKEAIKLGEEWIEAQAVGISNTVPTVKTKIDPMFMKFVGTWTAKGQEHDGVVTSWKQTRKSDGTLLVTLFETADGETVETYRGEGKWWMAGGGFYEFDPNAMSIPVNYVYEFINDDQTKLSIMKPDQSQNTLVEAYSFIETRVQNSE